MNTPLTADTLAKTEGEVEFSEQIRGATATDHRNAEHSPFMSALMAKRAERDHYIELVAQQYLFYEVLERAAQEMANDPTAGPFVFDELTRLPSLQADLEVLVGSGWREALVASDATEAYVARMNEVCFDWPGGFVAHHYTRYLGDLSGGQFIGRSVVAQFDLTDGGATFFTFSRIGDAAAFKERYRRLLDSVVWSVEERSQVIDEVRRAYGHNSAVLASIGGS